MRTVSGIQPTGNLHLGNYLGAIKNWVKLQERSECLFFLADMHAITVHVDPATLSANCREMVAALIAAGVDPEKSILFNQARVPQHAELAWLLICNTPMGWLDRMTQFKEKSGKHKTAQFSRALWLSGFAGSRCSDLSGDARPGWRRSETASRAGARYCEQVQRGYRCRCLHTP